MTACNFVLTSNHLSLMHKAWANAGFDGGGKGQLIISISKLNLKLPRPQVFSRCSLLLLSFSFTHLWRVWLPLWGETEWEWSEEITFKIQPSRGGTFPRNPARDRWPLAGCRAVVMPELCLGRVMGYRPSLQTWVEQYSLCRARAVGCMRMLVKNRNHQVVLWPLVVLQQ